MKKKYPPIELSADVQAFRDRLIAATQWEKTTCGITFYKMHGAHFARAQSSLTGKKVKKHKRFQRTMHNAGILSQAATIVAPIYNALTEDWRCHELYRRLTGLAARLLHAGKSDSEVPVMIQEELFNLGYRTVWPECELPPNLQQWLEEENDQPADQPATGGMEYRQWFPYDDAGRYSLMVDRRGRLSLHSEAMPSPPP